MPFAVHTVELPDQSSLQASGNGPAYQDRIIVGKLDSVANGAGGGAGATVAVTVRFGYELPANYAVQVTPSQAAFVSVGTKTSNSFVVTLTPTTASITLAAGTFDVLVVA